MLDNACESIHMIKLCEWFGFYQEFCFCLRSFKVHQFLPLQDSMILFLMLTMIRKGHKHKVLNQMDLILMEQMQEVLIML